MGSEGQSGKTKFSCHEPVIFGSTSMPESPSTVDKRLQNDPSTSKDPRQIWILTMRNAIQLGVLEGCQLCSEAAS